MVRFSLTAPLGARSAKFVEKVPDAVLGDAMARLRAILEC